MPVEMLLKIDLIMNRETYDKLIHGKWNVKGDQQSPLEKLLFSTLDKVRKIYYKRSTTSYLPIPYLFPGLPS